MKTQKNFRLDDYTRIRIEDMAIDYDIPENRIVQLATLMMALVMNDDENDLDQTTVKELRKNFITKIKTIHGE